MKIHAHSVVLSPALRRLLLDLQTWCTADCCKGDAFRISEAAISRWLEGERIDRTRELAKEIAEIEGCLQQAEGRIALAVRGLVSDWDKVAFRAFWESFVVAFTSAVSVRKSADAEPDAHEGQVGEGEDLLEHTLQGGEIAGREEREDDH